jgi:hypothetical protein
MWCRVTLRRLSSYCIAKRTRPHNEPAEEMNSRNKFLELIVAPSNYSRVFFHSLLNSALSYDPVGWGIPYLSSLSLSLSISYSEYISSAVDSLQIQSRTLPRHEGAADDRVAALSHSLLHLPALSVPRLGYSVEIHYCIYGHSVKSNKYDWPNCLPLQDSARRRTPSGTSAYSITQQKETERESYVLRRI